ncbi:MAG: acyltransferase [Peptococcaceae bacterium]|nr:acyltransferase [Peptococcaceae bacterium]
MVVIHANLPFGDTFINGLLRYSTPLYVAIAGFLVGAKPLKVDLWPFMRRKLQFLLPPFLVWSIIYLAWSTKMTMPQLDLSSLLLFIAMGGAKGHLYFVPLILQLYLIFYLSKRGKISSLSTLIMGLVFFLPWMYFVVAQEAINVFNPLAFFPSMMVYFALGYFLAHNRGLYANPRPVFVLGAAIGVLIGIGIFFYCQAVLPQGGFSQHFYSMGYAVFAIYLFFCLCYRIKTVPGLLAKISQYSFCIYLAHWLFVDILNVIVVNQIAVVKFAILSIGALAASYLLGVVVNMLPYGKYLAGRPTKTASALGKRKTLKQVATSGS